MLNCLVVSLNHALILSQTKNKGEKSSEADLTCVHDIESDLSILDQAMTYSPWVKSYQCLECCFLKNTILNRHCHYLQLPGKYSYNVPMIALQESVTANKSSKQ